MVIIYTRAYNAENTIRATIESILNQTYTDFKYILFNNGSLDNTLSIMREYARKDKRIVILSSDVNRIGFLSNMPALKYIVNNFAEEDFFCNVDADDVYELDFFEKMVDFCVKNRLDSAFCGYKILERNTGKILDVKTLSSDLVVTNRELPEHFMTYRRYTTDMWAKFFKVSLLEYFFEEERFEQFKVRNNQQTFIFDALSNSARFGFLAQPLLVYTQSDTAQKNIRLQGNINYTHIMNLFHTMKGFVDSFVNVSGETRRRNDEYLYAIYYGYIKDIFEVIFFSNAISLSQKMLHLQNIFSNYVTQEMLQVKASDEFYSLHQESKRELCQKVVDFIKEHEENDIAVTYGKNIINIMHDCGIDV